MSLKQQIKSKLNEALKAKDKNTYPTLRLVVSAIKDAEIAGRSKGQKEVTDSEITSILKKMIKQRNESCEVYKKAERKELLKSETREIEVISTFLPEQLRRNKKNLPRNSKSCWSHFNEGHGQSYRNAKSKICRYNRFLKSKLTHKRTFKLK
jgi:uncharacterized protein YqeY